MRRSLSWRGITLVELLVVVAILALLMAILLPAVQSIRESTRRTHCANNLKQIGVALQSFHQAHEKFPVGSDRAPGTDVGAFGHSWWIYILPMVERSDVYDRFDRHGVHSASRTTGYPGYAPPPGTQANVYNAGVIDGLAFPFAWCPSSPLRRFTPTHYNPKGRPHTTYTGVAGSSDHATAESFNDGTGVTPPVTGRISFGGFFPPRTATNHSEFSDGLSNTLSVVEQSDFCRTSSGGAADCRSDCGHGFQMGKKASDERIFNTTTIYHPINTKGSSAFGVPGNCGPNRPILAAHLGGATALFADGSVHFLEESLELQVLYNLGNRDDGNALALPW